jgi:hypothetical protein
MAATDTPLQFARMATMAIIPMPAPRMGTTARLGLMAASLLGPVPGIVATDTAIAGITAVIAADTTDGRSTAAVTVAATLAADTAEAMLVVGTAEVQVLHIAGVAEQHTAVVAAAADSTVVVVAAMPVVVTGKSSIGYSKIAAAGINPAATFFWRRVARYPSLLSASLVAS